MHVKAGRELLERTLLTKRQESSVPPPFFRFVFSNIICGFCRNVKQTERNEVIFHEKRASAYKGKVVEFFVKTLEFSIDTYYSL